MRREYVNTKSCATKYLTVAFGVIPLLHGAISLAVKPACEIGLFGIPEAAWAGGAISSGIACLLVSYLAFWRR